MHIEIENPCQADWNEMRGDHRERFCAHCQHAVHDMSSMTRQQADELLKSSGKVCVRVFHDSNGSAITAESRSQVFIKRRTFAKFLAAGAAASLFPILGEEQQQAGIGALNGSVVDAAGRVIMRAKVQLKNGDKLVAETDSSLTGTFRLTAKTGSYRLVVSASGFQKAEQEVKLRNRSAMTAKVVMHPDTAQPPTLGPPRRPGQ